jgi:multicomponent Na+:H+ antiporter subunit B
MSGNVILRVAAKILCPNIFLFALYVQFHGDFGPGGGFQAGVIMASGFVLYALVYGLEYTQRVLPPVVGHVCMAMGAFIYAGTGVAALLAGGSFLEYNAFAVEPHVGQEWGIFSVEFGVLLTVFGAMISIFYAFAGRRGLR